MNNPKFPKNLAFRAPSLDSTITIRSIDGTVYYITAFEVNEDTQYDIQKLNEKYRSGEDNGEQYYILVKRVNMAGLIEFFGVSQEKLITQPNTVIKAGTPLPIPVAPNEQFLVLNLGANFSLEFEYNSSEKWLAILPNSYLYFEPGEVLKVDIVLFDENNSSR